MIRKRTVARLRRPHAAAGLTLIQLMLVIGLIGIVAAVLVRMLLEPGG